MRWPGTVLLHGTDHATARRVRWWSGPGPGACVAGPAGWGLLRSAASKECHGHVLERFPFPPGTCSPVPGWQRPGVPEGDARQRHQRRRQAAGCRLMHGVQAERGEGDDRVTTVREDFGQGPDGTGEGRPGQPAAETPRPPEPRRWHPLASLTGLVRHHWLFSLALAAGVVPRVVAMLGYRPAMLFRLDTFDYLWGAVHLSPNVVNPSGYSLFLW